MDVPLDCWVLFSVLQIQHYVRLENDLYLLVVTSFVQTIADPPRRDVDEGWSLSVNVMVLNTI